MGVCQRQLCQRMAEEERLWRQVHHLCQRMAEEEQRRRQQHHLCLRKALEEQLWLQCQRMAEEHRWRHGVVMKARSTQENGAVPGGPAGEQDGRRVGQILGLRN